MIERRTGGKVDRWVVILAFLLQAGLIVWQGGAMSGHISALEDRLTAVEKVLLQATERGLGIGR